MPITFSLNNAVNNDQSSGLQTTADSSAHVDTDVSVASLNGPDTSDDFYDRLVALSLLADAFATDVGAASQLNSVTVTPSGNGEITSLGFTGELDDNGSPGDPSDDTSAALSPHSAGWAAGGATGLETVDGEEIRLFIDEEAGLGDQLVFGIDENGVTVFAVYMYTTFNPDNTVKVDFHVVSFEALYHPNGGDPDDEVDLGDYLTISASETTIIDFDGTPSGKNLFTMVPADSSNLDGFSVVVTPGTEEIVLNTSKGGGPTTLALYNQMIDPGEELVFTFVNDPVDDFTVPNLDQNEADLETNILFSNLEYLSGGSVIISQTQGQGPHALTLAALAADNTETTGNGFIDGYADDTIVPVTSITVTDETGADIFTWTPAESGQTEGGVQVIFNGDGTIYVEGFDADYTIFYDAANHARLSVTGELGKFDIGGIGVDLPGAGTAAVGDNVVFDDDGPTAALATTAATLVVDETDNDGDDADGVGGDLANVTVAISTLFDDTSVFGTDGPKDADDPENGIDDDATTYSLVLNGGDGTASGLYDTATGEQIYLYWDDNGTPGDTSDDFIVGLVGNGGAPDPGGAESFRIVVTNDPDEVQVIQSRAVVHDDPDDHDENTGPESMIAGLVEVQVTVIDDDGDSHSDTAELGSRIDFEDDGPNVTKNGITTESLTTDDDDITSSATDTGSYAALFSSVFGADGAFGGDPNTAVTYTLGVEFDGTDSGLDDALTGDDILLRMNGTVVEGYLAGSTGTIAFTVSVVATGATGGDVTLTQLRAILHDNPNDPDEVGAEAETMSAANKVTLTATAKDGDSDTDAETEDIGQTFNFLDDGPEVDIQADLTATLALDETVDGGDDDNDGDPLATNSITVADYLTTNSADPGNDGEKSDAWSFEDPDPADTGTVYSGLVDTASGEQVVLNLEGNDIVARTETGGDEVARWTIDPNTGEVTVTQLRAVVHGNPNDPDEAATPETLNAGSIVVTRTIVDNDDDSADDSTDISFVFEFQDDGPTADIQEHAVNVVHDESDGEQNSNPGGPEDANIEDNNDDDKSIGSLPAHFLALGAAIGWAESASAVVSIGVNNDFGSDGEGTAPAATWSLDIPTNDGTVDSGFDDLGNHDILLRKVDDVVVGYVDDDDNGMVDGTEQVALAIYIIPSGADAGKLQVAQYVPMQHPTAAPDEQVIMNDGALQAVLTVVDGDGDGNSASEDIGNHVIVEDDGPSASANDPVILEEDDIDGIGNDPLDTADGAGDMTGTKETASLFLDPSLNVFEGADQPVSYNLKNIDPNGVLPALSSAGLAISYTLMLDQTTNVAGDTDLIQAKDSNGTLIFTIEVIDDGIGGAEIKMTVVGQLDHAIEAAPGTENTLLQLFGGGTAGSIDVTNMLDIKDKDGDPVALNAEFVAFQVIDDRPILSGPNTDPGVVDFLTGLSVNHDLNGATGTDQNAAGVNQAGDPTYTFTFAVDANETITSTSIADLQAVANADNTTITYFVDGYDGNPVDGVTQAGEIFFDVTLGDHAGIGDYTFNVYQGAPPAFTPFDFTDIPSGQNLFGVIAIDKLDLDKGGLLVFPEFVELDGDNEYTNNSQTTNTSKGGGPVTIGNSNQMFNAGEGHYFVYVDNPDGDSTAGVGLDQNKADDTDFLGFDGTIEVTKAQVEIVQVQGNSLASMTIEAFDLNLSGAVGTGDPEDPAAFAIDPETSGNATPVNITEVKVFDGSMTLLEHWAWNPVSMTYELQDINDDAVVDALDDHADVHVNFSDLGGGVHVANVMGIDELYTIEWTTEDPHDMSLVHADGGKYDIGGFNLLQINESPDQLFDYTIEMSDFDGDRDAGAFQVLVDGTGNFDDGKFDLDPLA